MSLLVPRRSPSREILDDADLSSEEMQRSLQDLETVNRIWRNARLLARALRPHLEVVPGSHWRILDVGAGSGGISRDLAMTLHGAGRRISVVATDLQWRHLAAGRALAKDSDLPGAAADAFALPFADGAADWVVSTLLFHHFSPAENVLFLRELARVARRGFFLVDLRRHLLPLLILHVAGRLTFRTRVSLEDGIASVRQAYTVREAAEIATRAIPGTRVRSVFPFRLLICRP